MPLTSLHSSVVVAASNSHTFDAQTEDTTFYFCPRPKTLRIACRYYQPYYCSRFFSRLERLIPEPAFAQYNFRLSLPSSAWWRGPVPLPLLSPRTKNGAFPPQAETEHPFCTDGRNGPPKHGEPPPAPFGFSVAWLSTSTSTIDLLFLLRKNIDRDPLGPAHQSECGIWTRSYIGICSAPIRFASH